jgi:DNA (cytosine-5)-methyltransferase 1
MIEFYLKNNSKNIRPLVDDLLNELEFVFLTEKISVEKTDKVFFPEIKGIVSNNSFEKVNSYYQTIEKNKERFPFLKNYVNKNKIELPKKNSFVDLFAGCGGLSLGLTNAGFHPAFVNEIEPTFAETFYFNHNLHTDQYYVGDINKLVSELDKYSKFFKNTTLVCGGPPCQGFSMANRQRLIDDPRNVLYKSYLKFLHEVRPQFFIMENVKGMAHKISEIIADFKKYLGDDYNFDYALLNAKDFGLPQNRERFFLIGNRNGVDTQKIFENIRKEYKFQFVLKDAISNLPALKPKSIKNNNDINNDEFGYMLRKIKLKKNKFHTFINGDKETSFLFNHKNRYNNERDVEIYNRLPQGANSLHSSISDIMPYASRNHMFKDKYFKLNENEVCKTITSHMKFDCNMYIHPTQARGLSPREAARVQTFPDNYFFRGSQNKWFAQIGNAVPVKLAEIIGKHIIKHLC